MVASALAVATKLGRSDTMTNFENWMPSEGIPSELGLALRSRKIDITAGDEDGAHIFQVLASRWYATITEISKIVAALEDIEPQLGSIITAQADPLLDAFRSSIYAAAETFDVYTQMLPDRLAFGRPKAEKKMIGRYQKSTGKRLRDPTATLCNKFKHGSRQLMLNSTFSASLNEGCFSYTVGRYKGGDKLVCDDEEHKRPERSTAFRKKIHEILHGLLAVDIASAGLVRTLADNSDIPISLPDLRLRVDIVIPRLLAKRVYVSSEERHIFNSVSLRDGRIVLSKGHAISLPNPTQRSTTVRGDGITRSFDFS